MSENQQNANEMRFFATKNGLIVRFVGQSEIGKEYRGVGEYEGTSLTLADDEVTEIPNFDGSSLLNADFFGKLDFTSFPAQNEREISVDFSQKKRSENDFQAVAERNMSAHKSTMKRVESVLEAQANRYLYEVRVPSVCTEVEDGVFLIPIKDVRLQFRLISHKLNGKVKPTMIQIETIFLKIVQVKDRNTAEERIKALSEAQKAALLPLPDFAKLDITLKRFRTIRTHQKNAAVTNLKIVENKAAQEAEFAAMQEAIKAKHRSKVQLYVASFVAVFLIIVSLLVFIFKTVTPSENTTPIEETTVTKAPIEETQPDKKVKTQKKTPVKTKKTTKKTTTKPTETRQKTLTKWEQNKLFEEINASPFMWDKLTSEQKASIIKEVGHLPYSQAKNKAFKLLNL